MGEEFRADSSVSSNNASQILQTVNHTVEELPMIMATLGLDDNVGVTPSKHIWSTKCLTLKRSKRKYALPRHSFCMKMMIKEWRSNKMAFKKDICNVTMHESDDIREVNQLQTGSLETIYEEPIWIPYGGKGPLSLHWNERKTKHNLQWRNRQIKDISIEDVKNDLASSGLVTLLQ